MRAIQTYTPTELKAIFRILQSQLLSHPELMDSDFLTDLQRHLQKLAQENGVDVSDHGQWATWLG